MRRQFVLLDNSAVNALFGQSPSIDESTLTRVMARLRAETDAYNLGVILTIPLLEEVAGIVRRNPARFQRVAEALWDLGDTFLLRPNVERHPLEARKRRKLLPYEVFYTRAAAAPLRQGFLTDPTLVQAGDQNAYEVKRKFEADEEQRRNELVAELMKHGRSVATAVESELGGPGRDWHAVVDEWTLFNMRHHPEFYGLPPDESDWPRPRDFVTLWFGCAYTVARLVEHYNEGRAIDGGDLYDAQHFEDAAYADVLVTRDEGLIRRAANYNLERLRILRPEAWVTEVLTI